MSERSDQLRQQILQLTAEFHAEAFPRRDFVPGSSTVPVSGKVIDAADISAVVDSALDGWFTTGRWAKDFERKLARFIGVRSASLVNSGSSANLVALSALTSPKLGARQLKPGDEVITVAAGFPTTVNPIFQNKLIPVFIDVTLPTYEIDVTRLEDARSEKTRAVMIAHTLGNVFNLDAITAFCKKYNLWLIEDCCDALGSTYKGQKVGTFGDIATVSFYPAHHITMGEGGAVLTDKPALQVLIDSFRDWGPRLLVRARCRQHLRQTLRLATRHIALRLRPQVHVLPRRLQPQGHRHAGRAWLLADRQAPALHRAPQGELRLPQVGTRRPSANFCSSPSPAKTPTPAGSAFPSASSMERPSPATNSPPRSRLKRSAPACSSRATCCASPRMKAGSTASSVQ